MFVDNFEKFIQDNSQIDKIFKIFHSGYRSKSNIVYNDSLEEIKVFARNSSLNRSFLQFSVFIHKNANHLDENFTQLNPVWNEVLTEVFEKEKILVSGGARNIWRLNIYYIIT